MQVKLDIKKYGYYSLRSNMMAVSLLFLLAWAVFGFDSVIDTLFYPRIEAHGVGLHYSTLHAVVFLFYISIINFHVGGIKSVKHLYQEMKKDLISIKCLFKNREEYVLSYDKHTSYDVIVGLAFSGCVAFVALFVFEYPYVFMLNYYQYNDLFFPIYLYNATPISPTFIRNTLGIILPLVSIILITKAVGYQFRLDKIVLALTLCCIAMFTLWVYMPASVPYQTIEDVDINLDGDITVWPNQELFPQTIYIYLNITDVENGYHERNNLDGWYIEDHPVHFVNVMTKYMVFLAVGYIFIIKVKDK